MKYNERQVAIGDLMETSGVRFGTSGARGLAVDMTNDVCFAYATAFLQAISATSGSVALAIDLRPSSPGIAAACAAAIRHAGLEVDYCGAIPTPALAYYAQLKGVPAIMVTGSHIPFDRNGIKFYGTSGEISKADENNISSAVVNLPERDLLLRPDEVESSRHAGEGRHPVSESNRRLDPGLPRGDEFKHHRATSIANDLPNVNPGARQCYIDRYLRFFPQKCLAGMKLGLYEHSSVARDLLREILEALGASVISLGRTDEFVPIDTEAVNEDDVQRARDWAGQYGFDAIISTDGDADRPLVGDEHGQWLRGDVAGILCTQYLGAQEVVTTVSCNTAVELCGTFDRVVRTRIGSPYVIEAMEAMANASGRKIVGFEPNGGFLVGSSLEKDGRMLEPLLTRDAVLPILCLLSMAREKGSAVSGIARGLPSRFTASDRLQNFPTETSRKLLSDLAASIAAIDDLMVGACGKSIRVDQTDGLRIFFSGDDIVHFRPSGNAPELRCYAESGTQERAGGLVREGLRRFKLLAERTEAIASTR